MGSPTDLLVNALVSLAERLSKSIQEGITDDPTTESVVGRALRDFPAARSTLWCHLAQLVAAGITGAWAFVVANDATAFAAAIVVTALGVITGPLIVLILVFCGLAVRAPYAQRNEARDERLRLQAQYEGPARFDADWQVEEGSLIVGVTNQGPLSRFDAQITRIEGCFERPALPVSVKWRFASERSIEIAQGETQPLHLVDFDNRKMVLSRGAVRPGLLLFRTPSDANPYAELTSGLGGEDINSSPRATITLSIRSAHPAAVLTKTFLLGFDSPPERGDPTPFVEVVD